MKVILQRVKEASVRIRGEINSRIREGMCLLVGIEKGDTERDAEYLARKVAELRVFPDEEGKMNRDLSEIKGQVLAVSQFTLAGSLKKGRRPSFDKAEYPERAEKLFDYFVERIRQKGIQVETGIFGALMEVHLVNDGPVTFILEPKKPKNTKESFPKP
ncbi:MAG: D-aminoacyl-tRNA deacylase [Candidatus Aminicenantes bacterium]